MLFYLLFLLVISPVLRRLYGFRLLLLVHLRTFLLLRCAGLLLLIQLRICCGWWRSSANRWNLAWTCWRRGGPVGVCVRGSVIEISRFFDWMVPRLYRIVRRRRFDWRFNRILESRRPFGWTILFSRDHCGRPIGFHLSSLV